MGYPRPPPKSWQTWASLDEDRALGGLTQSAIVGAEIVQALALGRWDGNYGIGLESFCMPGVLEHLLGVGALHAEHERWFLALGGLRQNFHALQPLLFGQLGVLAGRLRPDHSLDTAANHELDFAGKVLIIDRLRFGVRRCHDGERPAHRLLDCGIPNQSRNQHRRTQSCQRSQHLTPVQHRLHRFSLLFRNYHPPAPFHRSELSLSKVNQNSNLPTRYMVGRANPHEENEPRTPVMRANVPGLLAS